ncbi:MAG: UDP-glucose/GDP-mannose dehydrogenase family protein [Patescibacteria group bacterium]|nr:UDP-glucose/GDP-mannose dehydrogenase family protein [Patescibacteria group bacterium]
MEIAIFGTGYVGLVSGACLSNKGSRVTCVDVDKGKIEILNGGGCPIHEKDLPARLAKGFELGTLSFATDAIEAIHKSDVIFITVGTPSGSGGEADLSAVFQVARTIGQSLEKDSVIVQKSTVPVGTSDEIERIIKEELSNRGEEIDFWVVSNPEFLKEGNAVRDFESPDRVIIGTDSAYAEEIMRKIYKSFMRKGDRIVVMKRKSAEATKYAANVMLALRVSFINLMARFTEVIGADITEVRVGVGSDKRIGSDFLFPGVGFGGSCFPKDVRAMIQMLRDCEIETDLVDAILSINASQREWFIRKITRTFPDMENRRFAVWGLAFKSDTNDVREAPSLDIVRAILVNGGTVVAFDSVAVERFAAEFGRNKRLSYSADQYQTLEDCDALVILTKDDCYENPDFVRMTNLLRKPIIFDGRNLFDPKEMQDLGIKYFCVGR